MWKTMSFELDAEAQGAICDRHETRAQKQCARARRTGQTRHCCALEERVGVARIIAAAAAIVCVQKAPESLIALRTENAVDAPQRCE